MSGGHQNPTMEVGGVAPEAARLMRLATYASVGVAGILVVAKSIAWLMTDSVSLLSTLLDSFLDALASGINLWAVRHALQPADKEHRFGHGKAEPLAGLVQAAFISGSAVFLLMEASERIVNPKTIGNTDAGLVVMAVSIALTLVLVGFQKYVVKKTGSVAISADSLHYQTDLLVNLGVMISLVLVSRLGWGLADPLFAVMIAAYILWGAWRIGILALDHLMDKELPDEDRRRIHEIACAHEDVIDMHDLRTRFSGTNFFIQLHLEMSGDITLFKAHDVAESVMRDIEAVYPNAEVLIHEDPHGTQERRAEFK